LTAVIAHRIALNSFGIAAITERPAAMTPELSRFLQAAAVIAAFVSAMVLYYGALGAHRELQNQKEHPDTQVRRRRRQRAMRWVGMPAAAIALVCQLIVILYPSPAY
jgi:hypothetical protein